MAHVMRESPHAPNALVAAVTSVNVPPPCSILYEDWEPYYAEDRDLRFLLDWGIKKNIEYGIYRCVRCTCAHNPQKQVARYNAAEYRSRVSA